MSLKRIFDMSGGNNMTLPPGFSIANKAIFSNNSIKIKRAFFITTLDVPLIDYFQMEVAKIGNNSEKYILIAKINNHQNDFNPKEFKQFKMYEFDIYHDIIGRNEFIQYSFTNYSQINQIDLGSPMFFVEAETIA